MSTPIDKPVDKPKIAAYRRHLLVCTGPRCAQDGAAQALLDSLGAKFKAAGVDEGALRVKRSRVSCFAACKGGPVLCVQPDGVWYHDVTPANMDRIIGQHLVGGHPVDELVFHRGPTFGDAVAPDATPDATPDAMADAAPVAAPAHLFSDAERRSFYQLAEARRDMRHFSADVPIDDAVLARLLGAAHHAPSVGLMQPWRYVRVRDPAVRAGVAALVERERVATAEALGDRGSEFMRLKVEGVRECAELLVVALAPDDGTVFGRRTMPRDMALCSLACSVQNLWLAARVENLGMGWVSMFEPRALADLLGMPAGAEPVGILCLGAVERFYDAPMLELEGWRQGRPVGDMVFTDRWDAASTPS